MVEPVDLMVTSFVLLRHFFCIIYSYLHAKKRHRYLRCYNSMVTFFILTHIKGVSV